MGAIISTPITDAHWNELHKRATALQSTYGIGGDLETRILGLRVLNGPSNPTISTESDLQAKMAEVFSKQAMIDMGVPADKAQEASNQLTAPLTVAGSYERVLGGAWGAAKEYPIQCVALALLLVGVIFLLYFWKAPAPIKTPGTLVGCGFTTAAVAAVGVAWLLS
jgi:hypothetical protein